MPRDRDIATGYMGSWANQWPQRTNRLIAENNARVDRNVESGALTPEAGRQKKDFNVDFYNKIAGPGSGKLFDTIDRRSGNFIDRRPPQSGLANLFARMFGRGERDTTPSGTYYPPKGINQRGMYFDYPEAKEVVGPRKYGNQVAGTSTGDALNYMASEIFNYGEDAILPRWAEESTAMDKFGEARRGLYDDQGMTIGTDDDFDIGLNKAKMDAVKQLTGEYTQSGEFDYPDPGMVYGTDDYMLENPMIPGYELGQGLDMDPNLEPIQPLRSKLMSELGLPAEMDWQTNPYEGLSLEDLLNLDPEGSLTQEEIAEYLGVA